MANIKSSAKRAQISVRNTLRNAPVKTTVKSNIRKFNEATDKENAAAAFRQAVVSIDKAVTKGVLHKSAAARRKSRLAKKLNKMA